ncbi:MAG TPA: D-arabinono-1,4-lactone oxidase [Mycobacteriales bacterium]|nr:D-arabinono-1,4-lactone oxidase [Mycobacteriales bacterium]
MREIWSNWAGEQRCAPVELDRPTSEAELVETVRRARDRGLTVRAVGAGHSFTDCACTDGVLIDTSGLQRVLDVDEATGRVTVEGGARLYTLGKPLADRGLALENQGDIDRQSIAGAVSTATHGTGVRLRNLSAQIVGIRLVTASGDVLDLSPETDEEGYLAARVSIGALGVIAAVTIQCVPLYTLHRHDEPLPLADTLARLDEHVDGNDHFEFFVWPYTDVALTRSTRRSADPPSPPPHWRRYVQEEVLENRVLGLVCRTGRMMPRLAPRLNRLVAGAMSTNDVEDRAYKVYATTRAVRFTEMEYAIPRECVREAVERVMRLVEDRALPILFPLEVRFAAPDEAFLSTAYGRDTGYIAVHQFCGMEFETYFRAVEAIMDSYGGRPHWGKRHYQSAATLRERYPEWDRFQAVRARLDPDGVFANDYSRRVLGGPVGSPSRRAV